MCSNGENMDCEQIDLAIEDQLDLCKAGNRILDAEVNECLDGMQMLITKIDECLNEAFT